MFFVLPRTGSWRSNIYINKINLILLLDLHLSANNFNFLALKLERVMDHLITAVGCYRRTLASSEALLSGTIGISTRLYLLEI